MNVLMHGHEWMLTDQQVERGWRIWVYTCQTCGAVLREQVSA